MTSIKVLHYLRNLGLGGTEKTCQLFFEHAGRDFEVALVHEATGDQTRLEEFQKSAKVSGGSIVEVDSYHGDPQSSPSPIPLRAIVSGFAPDILHLYRSGYAEFPEPGHDIEVPHCVETNVFGFFDQNPKIERTLFMSKWLGDHAFRGLTPNWEQSKRFDFVNNPVEMPYTDTKFLNLSSDAVWLGRCGRPDNGIYNSVSVDAAHLLRLQGHDVRFLVVAAPPNMILDLERYEIPFEAIAPTTDPLVLSKFYNSVDVYAHARADGETFGVNIAEAMIHGKPVVTHIAVPSNPDMGVFQSQTTLVDHGQTGFVVENEPAAYAGALKAIIDNESLRQSMSYCAIAKAIKEYHVDVCMAKLENIYRDVVAGK